MLNHNDRRMTSVSNASQKRKAAPLERVVEGEAESNGLEERGEEGGDGGRGEEKEKATVTAPVPEEAQKEKTEVVMEQEKKERKVEKQVMRPRKTTPYGTWEQIKPEEDP